ncbi:MAG: hypothetical protein ACKE51_09675 [Methylococcaceae bacterium]
MAAAEFSLGENQRELYDQWAPILAKGARSKEGLLVGDSKKVFSQAAGLGRLERHVLAATALVLGDVPATFGAWLEAILIDKSILDDLTHAPWYKGFYDMPLPMAAVREDIESLHKTLSHSIKELPVKLSKISLNLLTEPKLNQHIDKYENKARACREALDPLFIKHGDGNRLTVDRQGGRCFYYDWLIEVYPQKPLMIRKEEKDLSVYAMGNDGESIQFPVKADATYLEVALASMVAKYTRECLMHCFNDYWQKKIPDLRRTAGYPQDAKRFLKNLKDAGLDVPEAMVRKR